MVDDVLVNPYCDLVVSAIHPPCADVLLPFVPPQTQLTSEFVPGLMSGPDASDMLVERPDDAGVKTI